MKRHLIYYTHVKPNHEQNSPIHVQARLHEDNDKSVPLTCILDRISRDGMTLSCDRMTLNLLLPNKSGIAPKNPVSLETEFSLNSAIKASCRVVYTRRLSKNEYILELKFHELTEKDMNQIDEFIECSLNGTQALLPKQEKIQHKPSLHQINVKSKDIFSKVA